MSDTEDIQILEEDIQEFDPEEQFEFKEPQVQLDTDYSNIVVIDGLPVEPEAKAEKLSIFVKKVIAKKTKIENFENFSMPIGRDKKTKGFCFVELANAEEAKSVQKNVNGFDPIGDGKMVFKVYTLAEIDRIEKASAEQPEQKPAAPKTLQERENYRTWLQDEKARDQYAIRHFDMVEVFWNDSINKAVSVQSKKNWSEDRIAWSPFGSYLITFHIQGIALWGGDSWKNVAKFAHKKPVFLDFSPNERYIVIANEDSTNNVMIAEVKTQRKLKFTIPVQELKRNWPNFKWSADEKYFSEIHVGKGLVLYNASDFSKKTVPIDGIQNYSWSPSDGPTFMYWIPDSAPLPGKVALMNVENGKEIRFKNSFNITNVTIHWNKSGDYVAAQIERTSKKEKKIESQFEIFRLKEKNIPIDTIEIKETVVNFAWEPFGHKFGIIHSSDPNKKKVSFYGLAKGNFKLIRTIQDKSVDMFFFSPKGRFVILANTNSDKGVIEFWDINEEPEMVGQGEHYMMSDLEWDPSGRYVTTYVSAYTRYSDYGYIIWTFLGKIHHKYTADKFWQFLWRPRPPTLLTAKDEKEIQKSFAEKKKQYLKEEKDAFENSKEQHLQVRKQLWQDFLDLQARWKAEYEQERAARSKLLGFDGERERDYKVEMVEVEEVLSRKEEEVSE